jgi:hypothetical protein
MCRLIIKYFPRYFFVIFGICVSIAFLLRVSTGMWVLTSDGLSYYAHLRSAIIDCDLNYANEFRDYNPYHHSVPDFSKTTETNHVPNKYPIGPALLWSPFVLLAHLLTLFFNSLGFNLQPDGYSLLYQVAVGIASIFYGIIGLFFIYKTCLRYFESKIVRISIFVYTLSSSLIAYLAFEPSLSHAVSLFAVSLLIWLCVRNFGSKNNYDYLFLGIVSGLMLLMRFQNGLFMLLPFIELITVTFKSGFSLKRVYDGLIKGFIYLSGLFLIMIPQFIVWKIIYGKFFLYTYSGEEFYFLSPKFIYVLFNASTGLLSFTPIIALSLIGFVFFIKNNVRIGTILLSIFILQVYVVSSWWSPEYGVSFGGRAFIECSPIFILGLSSLLKTRRTVAFLLYAIFGVLILWNFGLLLQFYLYQQALTPGELTFGKMLQNHIDVLKYISKKFFYR